MPPRRLRVALGALLTGDTLLAELGADEQIFRTGSWDPRQVDGCGYNLRVADRWLVVPSASNSTRESYRVVAGDGPNLREFVLGPGQSAVVATEERWSMGFGVAATIGPKFRWSARGLLLLHGMAAHPGYGRRRDADGWELEEDLRLYLIVVNFGPEQITLRHKDTIAYAQFYRTHPMKEPIEVNKEGFDRIRARFFSEPNYNPAAGIGYMAIIREMREEISRTEEAVGESRRDWTVRAENIETSVERVSNATDQVVVFGVFLVAATLLGVAAVVLTEAAAALPKAPAAWQWILVTAIAGTYVVGVASTAITFIRKTRAGKT